MNISNYAHVIPVENEEVFAVFNSLWLRTIFLHNSYLPFVQDLRKGISIQEARKRYEHLPDISNVASAMEEEYMFDNGRDQQKLAEIRNMLPQLPISILYLITSTSCNLACSYCYLSDSLNRRGQDNHMTEDMAQRAIDKFAEVASDQTEEPQIVFYGGEPTLNWPLIEAATEYAEVDIPGSRFIINTNGTTLDSIKASFFAKHNFTVVVSLDGPQKIHDAQRITSGGKPTFKKVVEGCRLLQRYGVNPNISCTITPANAGTLLDVMNWLDEELKINSVGFNLMMGPRDHLEDYSQKAADMLVECFEYARDHGIHEDRMMRRVDALVKGKLTVNDCGACGQQLVATPYNTLGVCQGFMNSSENFLPIAEVDNPNTHPLWQQWKQRTPFNMHECLSCEALGLCGGGCPYSSYQTTGNIMLPDTLHCTHTKTALRFMIQDLYAQLG